MAISRNQVVASATRKQRQGFQPGASGNPKGRTPGTRNRSTIAAEELLDGEAQALTRKAISMALDGDGLALRLCLERILPPRRSRMIRIDLPPVTDAATVAIAQGEVIAAVASGEICPDDGATVSALLEARRRAIETVEMEARLAAVEARVDR